MKPLIDGDVIVYEIGFCGEYYETDETTGEKVLIIREWDFVEQLLVGRIEGICKDVDATEPPIVFFTASEDRTRRLNQHLCLFGHADRDFQLPLREGIATQKPYKGTRKGSKPFHFDNIFTFLIANYECILSDNGLEADDEMSIYQWARRAEESTIICSRDKDLRITPGWQFGWECGLQPSFGPEIVDNKGWLKLDRKGEVKGAGLKFFFYQMLVGDTVDNIPGCPKVGPVKALALLQGCDTKKDHEAAVRASYEAYYGPEYKPYLEEQSKLLWMVRELNEDGSPVYYDWKL